MLPTYASTITFSASNDYRKLVVLLHAMAAFLLIVSTCPLWVMLLLVLALLIQGARLFCRAQPSSLYHQLVYRGGDWHLDTRAGTTHVYRQCRIVFDVAFLMQLELVSETDVCRFFLFHDQLTSEQRRALYLRQLSYFKSTVSCVKIDTCD